MNVAQIANNLISMSALAESDELELRTRGRITTAWSRHNGVLRKLFTFPSVYQSAILLRLKNGELEHDLKQVSGINAGSFSVVRLVGGKLRDHKFESSGFDSLSFKKGALVLLDVPSLARMKTVESVLRKKYKPVQIYSLGDGSENFGAIRSAIYDAIVGLPVCLISSSKNTHQACKKVVPESILSSVLKQKASHRIERNVCKECSPAGIGCALCEGTGIRGLRHVIVMSPVT